MSIRGCSTIFRDIPGVGVVAKFDPLSTVQACKKLYDEGTPYQRNELVRSFCNRFEKGNIPDRCKCYRFKDMPEFEKYSSLWANLLDNSKNGIAGDPVVGSFACFYEGCTADPDVYRTTEIVEASQHCPSTVFCKQVVGDLNVDGQIETKGKTLGQISIDIEQECGTSGSQPNANEPENNSNTSQQWYTRFNLIIVGLGILLLILIGMLFWSKR